ncbi:MAG: hypothetical protein ACI857_003091, partial [Arenicella sp.]
ESAKTNCVLRISDSARRNKFFKGLILYESSKKNVKQITVKVVLSNSQL